MNESEDADFMNKIVSNDEKSLNLIVSRWTTPIFKKCRLLGFSEEESEDIVQSTWVTFFDAAKNFRGESKIYTFIFGIMFNKCSEYKRKNFRLKDSINLDDLIDQDFDEKGHWINSPLDPEKFSLNIEIGNLLKKCLELLPTNQKVAFYLKEIEGIETPEICEQIKCVPNNLGILLYRARNQLRLCLENKLKEG
jgi:RNA polymerase sigma-70 factor (ECF subfamily)